MMDRRQFVKTAGLGALAGAAISAAGSKVVAAEQSSDAPQSSAANGTLMPRVIPICCAYSYAREFHYQPVRRSRATPDGQRTHRPTGTLTLEDFISKTAVDMKTNAVDVTFYYVASTDPAYLVNLRRLGHDHAVAFAGTACGSSLVQADPAARAEVLSDIKKWVDATDLLGASHLRIFAGELPDGAKLSDAVDWTVEGMKAACDYSGQKGITLGLEDHSGVTQTADVCLEIMQRVNSPYAGINLDITNFIDTPTQDAYAQIEACVPWATHVHIRDRFYGDQHLPVDMDRVWQIFAKGGMQCYISAEYEQNYPGALPPAEAVPKLVNDIKTLCKQYSSA